ncbi:MAG: alpha/beta hydrolase [Frondihabitans sp.]|nr:alpha/beta hydrolase [Frondihabitans sp.]
MKQGELAFTDVGAGPPLVLLMGLGAPGSAWAPHSDVLQQSFRCLIFDNPGTGSSALGEGALTTQSMARAVLSSLTQLGIDRFSVAGISMGACIAQELALTAPSLVDRLLLVAPWAQCDASTGNILDLLHGVRREASDATFTALLQNLVWTPQWFNEHRDELLTAQHLPVHASPATIRQQVSACRSHDALDRLRAIDRPVLVTVGSDDRFIRPELSEAVAASIPDARLERFDGLGHVHHWEDLDRFNRLAKEWFA